MLMHCAQDRDAKRDNEKRDTHRIDRLILQTLPGRVAGEYLDHVPRHGLRRLIERNNAARPFMQHGGVTPGSHSDNHGFAHRAGKGKNARRHNAGERGGDDDFE